MSERLTREQIESLREDLLSIALPTLTPEGEAEYNALCDMALSSLSEGWVMVPKEPSEGRLMSMAIRQDHALGHPGFYDNVPEPFKDGITHQQRIDAAIREMRQLYEEATGQGFYKPENEAEYLALRASPPVGKD